MLHTPPRNGEQVILHQVEERKSTQRNPPLLLTMKLMYKADSITRRRRGVHYDAHSLARRSRHHTPLGGGDKE